LLGEFEIAEARTGLSSLEAFSRFLTVSGMAEAGRVPALSTGPAVRGDKYRSLAVVDRDPLQWERVRPIAHGLTLLLALQACWRPPADSKVALATIDELAS
jgi:hypothetical protein